MSDRSNQPPNLFFQKNGQRTLGSRSTRRSNVDTDQAVRNTDHDASIARFSAVSKKYINELVLYSHHKGAELNKPDRSNISDVLLPFSEFAQLFVPSNQDTIRPPWVNIGTHHRTYLIDALVERFIDQVEGPKQVLSIGSGSDSRYWRLKHARGEKWPVEKWIETDFQETVSTKIRNIMLNNQLQNICGHPLKCTTDNLSENNNGNRPPNELHAKDYGLISLDLRQSDQFKQKLRIDQTDQEPLLKQACPTLIIAELVFLYMSPEQTKSCLKQLCSIFENTLMVITYEALNLNDNFSKMMVQNLSGRGLTLLGFDHNCSVDSQIKRFQELDFTEIISSDMKKLRDSNGTNQEWKLKWDQELKRIKRLEFLDEVEELELILKHYAITCAIKSEKSKTTLISKDDFYLPHFSST